MITIEKQVYIYFDGPDGLVIQTGINTYEHYYKPLGWELMGPASALPGMKPETYEQGSTTQDNEPEPVVETIGRQVRLF